MPLSLWNTTISKLYLWATEVTSAYLWSTQVFSSATPNWLLNNLLSYYKMDTNWSFPDSHWSNNGVINGATFTTAGKINWGYSFDWVNDSINLNWINLNSSTFSITWWVKVTTTASFDYFMDMSTSRLILGWDTSNPWNFHHFDWVAWRDSWQAINSWSWTFFALVKDGTSYKMRVNWTTVNWVWNTINASSWTTRLWSDFNSSSVFFQWELDEMWFWSWRALSDSNLDDIYNSWAWLSYNNFTASPPPPNWLLNNLLSYYKMDTNWSFPDAHWSNNGVINGATFTTAGKINWGYSFDWSNDFVSAWGLAVSTAYTVSCWVNFDSIVWERTIMRLQNSGTTIMYIVIFQQKWNLYHSWWAVNIVSSVPAPTTWQYTHVVMTYTGSSIELFINGSFITSLSGATSLWPNNWLEIWWRSTSGFLDWQIDELWIWDRALTPTEISNLYNNNAWLSYDNFTT